MSSILDIDLDYFNLVKNPVRRLHDLLEWGNRPVDIVVERHHRVLRRWKALVRRGVLTPPTHILHVDEHHDMMDGTRQPNIGNVMRHAMTTWLECRVYWMAEGRIDDPGVWLEDELWRGLRKRFRMGTGLPRRWPKPDLVSVCTSPGFVDGDLLARLMAEVERAGVRPFPRPSPVAAQPTPRNRTAKRTAGRGQDRGRQPRELRQAPNGIPRTGSTGTGSVKGSASARGSAAAPIR